MHLLQISEYKLIWYDDVMRKDDSDTISVAMETNVKGKIEGVDWWNIKEYYITNKQNRKWILIIIRSKAEKKK